MGRSELVIRHYPLHAGNPVRRVGGAEESSARGTARHWITRTSRVMTVLTGGGNGPR